MQPDAITTVFLPIAVGVIMLGLGLSLRLDDFKRVLVYPRAVAIGLACQMLVLPAVALGLGHLFALPPELAVGLMLLAASPGGATANLFSHLAKGDVALNITLTAVNSVLSLITLPFIINFSLAHFLGEGRSLPLQPDKVIQVVFVVLIPAALGMIARARSPAFADRLDRPVRILSAVFLVAVVASAIIKQRANIPGFLEQVGLAALAFNVASMLVGYFVPLLFRVDRKQAIAIGMEIGIHNSILAIAIASSPALLNNPTMAIPPAVYGVLMFFTAAAFGWIVSRRQV